MVWGLATAVVHLVRLLLNLYLLTDIIIASIIPIATGTGAALVGNIPVMTSFIVKILLLLRAL